MVDTPAQLAERLQRDGEKTLDFFRNIEGDEWERQVYTDGETWTVRHVLAHFVSSERNLAKLVANIADGGRGSPDGFDIDAFNQGEVHHLREVSPQDLLEQFGSLREATIRLVAGLNAEALNRIGRHPFLGFSPLTDIIKLIYRHNQIHLRDLRRIS